MGALLCLESWSRRLHGWHLTCATGIFSAPVRLQLVVHAADISNPARPLPLCRRWGQKVHEEFFAQGEGMRMQIRRRAAWHGLCALRLLDLCRSQRR